MENSIGRAGLLNTVANTVEAGDDESLDRKM